MTIDEKCWDIIKGMRVSGPWQEHMVHDAMMALSNSQWLDINESKPDDGQRVLTWNTKFHEVRIQVFNEEYQCWDTEDGDDIEFKLDATMKDGTQIIRYWQPLPKRPQENK